MSFLKNLFGFGTYKRSDTPSLPDATLEHKGYVITATPMIEGREFQVSGVIRREIDGVLKEHRFIRVDKLPTREDAVALILRKGQQIIDQSGDRMFE
jgi:hypothetical protein